VHITAASFRLDVQHVPSQSIRVTVKIMLRSQLHWGAVLVVPTALQQVLVLHSPDPHCRQHLRLHYARHRRPRARTKRPSPTPTAGSSRCRLCAGRRASAPPTPSRLPRRGRASCAPRSRSPSGSHPNRSRSTQPLGSNATPSRSSSRRCVAACSPVTEIAPRALITCVLDRACSPGLHV